MEEAYLTTTLVAKVHAQSLITIFLLISDLKLMKNALRFLVTLEVQVYVEKGFLEMMYNQVLTLRDKCIEAGGKVIEEGPLDKKLEYKLCFIGFEKNE